MPGRTQRRGLVRRCVSPDVRLCFLIPASPTDGFRGQVAMFRRALDHLGGSYERARMIVTFGGEAIEPLPPRWLRYFKRIGVRHADPDEYIKHSYFAQGDARWRNVPRDCDFAILSDADTMLLRPIDDLLAGLIREPRVAASIAHYPFPQCPGETPEGKWAALGRQFAGRELPLEFQHTLAEPSAQDSARCPFYVNFGFVVVPRVYLDVIGRTVSQIRTQVAAMLCNPFFATQIALTIAIYRHGIPHEAIDVRYNFPNDQAAERRHSDSLQDARLIHYLRTTRFDRHRIFADEAAFDAFLGLPLSGSELLLQQHVRLITAGRYPFS